MRSARFVRTWNVAGVMPIYTVQVTCEVPAKSERDAYAFIQAMLDHADIGHVESEITDTRPDEDDDAPPARKLTRTERLQGLADRGCDTWEELRGER